MAKYTELITKVIADFDSVLEAIRNKRGTGETSDLVWGPDKEPLNATGYEVPTEYYGELINQLVKIDGIDGSKNSLHRIANHTEGTVALTLGTVTKDSTNKKYTITANVGSNNGYYTDGSTLTIDALTTDVTLTPINTVLVQDATVGNFYTYEALDKLIGVVKVAKGAISGGIQLNDFAINADLGTTKINENKSTAIAELVPETDSGNEKYYVTIDTSVERGAVTVSADSTAAVSKEGYVTSKELNIAGASKTIDASSTAKTIKLAIKKGSVSAKVAADSKAEVEIYTDDKKYNSIWATTDEEIENAIKIKSSVGSINIQAVAEEGYIKSGVMGNGAVDGADTDIYLKTTSKHDVELTPTITTGTDTYNLVDKTDASTYTITVNSNTSSSESFGAGYLLDGDFEVNSNGSKTIHLNAAAVSTSSKITSYDVNGGTIATTTKTANNDYVITVTPTIDVSTKSVNAVGVITAATQITNTNATTEANASKEVYVKRGSVVVNTPVFDILYNEDSDDGKGAVTTGDLFKIGKPTDGDYFTINVNAGYTITDGYVTKDDGSYLANKQTATRYMPKAVLSWKKDEKTDEEVLTVDTAGYLPSGIISEFAPEGTLTNNAVVDLALKLGADDTGLVFQGEPAANVDAYTFTINKGSVDAGYISSNAGSLAENNFYITKAKFDPYVDVKLVDDENGFTYDEDAKTYTRKITASATGNANLTTAGFIKNETIEATGSKILDIVIDQADISLKHSASLNLEASSKIETVTSSPFSVSAAISSCKATIETKTAGYIDDNFDKEIDLSKDCIHTGTDLIYIKAGTGINTEGYTNDSVTVNAQTQNITENAAGNFEVTATVNATAYGEILSGYYDETMPEGDPINDVSIDVKKEGLKVATIERGKGSVSLANTSANVITSDPGIVLHNSIPDSTKEYIAIKANATVNASSTLDKAGYINAKTDIDVAGINGQVITAATKYIEVFKGPEAFVIGPDTEVEEFTQGKSEGAIIQTKDKYLNKDLYVTIGKHAMGSAVEDELLRLEQRLNGILKTTS